MRVARLVRHRKAVVSHETTRGEDVALHGVAREHGLDGRGRRLGARIVRKLHLNDELAVGDAAEVQAGGWEAGGHAGEQLEPQHLEVDAVRQLAARACPQAALPRSRRAVGRERQVPDQHRCEVRAGRERWWRRRGGRPRRRQW